MSDGLNRCQFIGHLGQDPELKIVGGSQAVLNFSLAATESYLDRNNVRLEKTEWIRCAVWGKRAEALAKILTKGMKVYVEGSMQTRSYDKNGQKHYATDINVRNVILCGGKRDGDGAGQSAGANRGGAGGNRSYGGGGGGEQRRGPPVGGGAHAPPPADDPGFDDFAGSGGDDEIPF